MNRVWWIGLDEFGWKKWEGWKRVNEYGWIGLDEFGWKKWEGWKRVNEYGWMNSIGLIGLDE